MNDGGKAIEAVAMGIGLTLVLIFSVFMISKNVDFSSMPTWDIRLSKTLTAAMFRAPMAVASRPSRTLVTARFDVRQHADFQVMKEVSDMATKRFDDATEQARALEAKAKKLRREAQAARTKAYADALVTVFPEVKDMGSAEEVLDFVKGLKPSTGHGTQDARAAGAAVSAHGQTAEAGESSEAHGGLSGSGYQE